MIWNGQPAEMEEIFESTRMIRISTSTSTFIKPAETKIVIPDKDGPDFTSIWLHDRGD